MSRGVVVGVQAGDAANDRRTELLGNRCEVRREM